MISLLTSTIAGVMIVVYLGYYAVRLHTPVLWIVIAGVLVMAIVDFVLTARGESQRSRQREQDNDQAGS